MHTPRASNNDLSSDYHVDYTRLRDLLAAGNWKDADKETITVILQATGRAASYEFIQTVPLRTSIEFFPFPEFIENCPCSVLRTIDQFWVKYSNGRFGFSVQKRIWDSVGHKYHKFGDRVGWIKGWWRNKHWILSHELTFDTSAPVGHLPFELSYIMEFMWVSKMCGGIFPAERAIWERACALQIRCAVLSRIQVCESPQPAVPTVKISVPDNLSSDVGVDYTRLRNLLAAKNWKEADKETYLVMILAVGKKDGDWFTSDELLNFLCTDLLTIDQLWIKYSNGHFGFSIQKEIYLSVDGEADNKYHPETWEKFGDRVGWRVIEDWICFPAVTFNTSSPKGHLPVCLPPGWWSGVMLNGLLVPGFLGMFGGCGSLGGVLWRLFSRIETCNMRINMKNSIISTIVNTGNVQSMNYLIFIATIAIQRGTSFTNAYLFFNKTISEPDSTTANVIAALTTEEKKAPINLQDLIEACKKRLKAI